MAKYLDATGLTQLWTAAKDKFYSKGGGVISGQVRIKADLTGNLADWTTYQHSGPFEVGRSSNTMTVAIGVTDDNYGYIQTKGLNITSPGNLVLLPAGGELYFSSAKKAIFHEGNLNRLDTSFTCSSLQLNATANPETGIYFRNGYASSAKYNCSILAYDHSGGTADGLSINGYDGVSFCTGSNTRQERARITGDGKVGIGTTSPSYLLHVNGIIGANSFVKVNGTSSQFLKADGSVDSTVYFSTGNDGSGSGLDADLLDGNHGDYYTTCGLRNLIARNVYNSSVSGFRWTPGVILVSGTLNRITFSGGNNYSLDPYKSEGKFGYYSISFWYKVADYVSGATVNVNINDISCGNFDVSADKDWTFWSATTTDSNNTRYGFVDFEGSYDATITLSDIVVVRGANKSQTWFPAPEDLVDTYSNQTIGGTKTFSNQISGTITRSTQLVDRYNTGHYIYATYAGTALDYDTMSHLCGWYSNNEIRALPKNIYSLSSHNHDSIYAKKDGTGATGTWGINISGTAATATTTDKLSWYNYGRANLDDVKGLNDGSVRYILQGNGIRGLHFSWDGGNYDTQIQIPEHKYNSSEHLKWRSNGNDGTWENWMTILDSSNYTSYCASASHTHSYLPLSGGELTSSNFYPLTINGGSEGSGLQLKGPDSKLGIVLFKPGDWGMAMLNYSASKAIGVQDNGTPYYGWSGSKYTLWHAGNFNPSNYSLTSHNHDSSYLTITTDQTVSGKKTYIAGKLVFGGNENNEITNSHYPNGVISINGTSAWNTYNGIKNALDFRWYDTHWLIGNIRGSSSNTDGFGIALKSGDLQYECLRVTTDGLYHKGQTVLHSGNYSSYASPIGHTHPYLPINSSSSPSGGLGWGQYTFRQDLIETKYYGSDDGCPVDMQHRPQLRVMRGSDTWSLTFGVKEGLGWIDCVANGIGYGDIYLNPAGEHVIVGNYIGAYSPFSRNSRGEKLIVFGEAYVSSTIEANSGFKKTGYDNSSILLAGGGTKAVSDFATSGHTHSYLPLSGGTVTGDVSVNRLNITNTSGVDEITFARGNYNYLRAKTEGGVIGFIANGKSMTGSSVSFAVGGDWISVNNGVAGNGGYNAYVNGSLNATTLYQNGTQVSVNGHTHSYLPLSGGTINGKVWWTNNDANLKIYGIDGGYNCGDETVALQTSFDGAPQDPETTIYTTSYANRCFLALQPRGGVVGIGLSTSSGNWSTGNEKLIVNGDVVISGELRGVSITNARIDEIIV